MSATRVLDLRFWEKVNKTDGCWLWTGSKDSAGYGHFRIDSQRLRKAHRISYELLVGPIPEGLQLDHLCRVRECVRPDHLEPVTNYTNWTRSLAPSAINARRTHCANGHPFSGENLAVLRDGRRQCRTCRNERRRLRYREKKVRYAFAVSYWTLEQAEALPEWPWFA